jgi:hypothetical protein
MHVLHLQSSKETKMADISNIFRLRLLLLFLNFGHLNSYEKGKLDPNARWDNMGTVGEPCVPLGTWWDDRVRLSGHRKVVVAPLCPTTVRSVRDRSESTTETIARRARVRGETTTEEATTSAPREVTIILPEATVSH